MDTIFLRPHILQWRKLIQIFWQSNGRNRNRNKYAIAKWKEAQSNEMIPRFVFILFCYTKHDRLPFRLICTEIKTQTDSNLADAHSIYTRRFLCVLTSRENDKMLKKWDTQTGLPLPYYRLHSRLTLNRLQTKRWRLFGFAILLLSNVKVSQFTL